MSYKSLLLVSIIFTALFFFHFHKGNQSWTYFTARQRELIHTLEKIHLQRKMLVKSVCSTMIKESIDHIIKYLDHLLIDDYHKLVYCYVPKIASTNWKRVLLAVNSSYLWFYHKNPLTIKGEKSHRQNVFITANKCENVTILLDKLKDYTKFIFVRNPLERLLSAYRNKFENVYNEYFRQRYGRYIISSLRPNASAESLRKGHDVLFVEFLTYINSINKSQHMKNFNEHWRPINELCFPCYINYDIIGHYETIEEDAFLVLWKTKLINYVRFPKREETYSNSLTSGLLKQYYKSIDSKLVKSIIQLYQDDFELFDYKFNDLI